MSASIWPRRRVLGAVLRREMPLISSFFLSTSLRRGRDSSTTTSAAKPVGKDEFAVAMKSLGVRPDQNVLLCMNVSKQSAALAVLCTQYFEPGKFNACLLSYVWDQRKEQCYREQSELQRFMGQLTQSNEKLPTFCMQKQPSALAHERNDTSSRDNNMRFSFMMNLAVKTRATALLFPIAPETQLQRFLQTFHLLELDQCVSAPVQSFKAPSNELRNCVRVSIDLFPTDRLAATCDRYLKGLPSLHLTYNQPPRAFSVNQFMVALHDAEQLAPGISDRLLHLHNHYHLHARELHRQAAKLLETVESPTQLRYAKFFNMHEWAHDVMSVRLVMRLVIEWLTGRGKCHGMKSATQALLAPSGVAKAFAIHDCAFVPKNNAWLVYRLRPTVPHRVFIRPGGQGNWNGYRVILSPVTRAMTQEQRNAQTLVLGSLSEVPWPELPEYIRSEVKRYPVHLQANSPILYYQNKDEMVVVAAPFLHKSGDKLPAGVQAMICPSLQDLFHSSGFARHFSEQIVTGDANVREDADMGEEADTVAVAAM